MTSVNVAEWLKLPLVPVIVNVRVPVVALRRTAIDNVDVPEPAIEAGVKVVVTREPWPLTARFTVPVNPFNAPIVTVAVPLLLGAIVMLVGATEMVKFGAGAGFTTRVTVVEWTRVPLVPVIVSVYVPGGVEALVVTDMVEVPEPVTELGLKLALAPAGSPVAVRPTTPVNPPDPVTVALYEVPPPAVTV
jgi:hypothetical protein